MHPDVPEEQAYFDHALDLRDRLEANLDRAASLAADPKTAMELRRRVGALGVVDPGQAVAFGRIDVDGQRWYIGRGAIWDENNDLVVVNWQAPVAAPFYTARPGRPEGLDRRRIYRCRDNRILDIDELVFKKVQEAVIRNARGGAEPGTAPRASGAGAPRTGGDAATRAGSAAGSNSGAGNPTGFGTGAGAPDPASSGGGRGAEPDTGGAGRLDPGGPDTGRGVGPDTGGGVGVPGPGGPSGGVQGRGGSGIGGVGPETGGSSAGHEGAGTETGDGSRDGGGAAGRGDSWGSRPSPDVVDPEPVVTDALLEALGRERSGHLSDIVATIQADQYDVISRDAEQLLIVQGAPGTGKTVVGLHRVSWLLFNRRDRIGSRDVLVVGPNPAFLRYISAVLPSLGDEAVVQLPVTALGPRVRIGRVDPPDVRRLKGDRRMLRFVLRGLRSRQRVGRSPVELEVEGRRVELDPGELASRVRQVAGQPHNEVRGHLRSFMVDEVQRLLARRRFSKSGPAMLDANVQATITHEVDAYLDRAWPRMTPQGFLVELLASRRRREVAGAGLLTDEETELLAVPHGLNMSSLSWAADDVPLLDLADSLLNGTPAHYQYIVVDEAQDLSPMQFESIRRRSRTGWMTVLGDLAQGTSPWVPESWDEVALHLRRDGVPTEVADLSLGYRLPTEVHDVAMRLLPEIGPGLKTPRPLRASGHPVSVTAARPDELTGAVVRAVRGTGGGLVGVITPTTHRERVREALEAEGLVCASELGAFPAPPIVVLGSEDAKGLEFDNVVVVEPAAIVAESPQGLRALFVALTRPTSRLALVHAEHLPSALGLESPLPGTDDPRIRQRSHGERVTSRVGGLYEGVDDVDDVNLDDTTEGVVVDGSDADWWAEARPQPAGSAGQGPGAAGTAPAPAAGRDRPETPPPPRPQGPPDSAERRDRLARMGPPTPTGRPEPVTRTGPPHPADGPEPVAGTARPDGADRPEPARPGPADPRGWPEQVGRAARPGPAERREQATWTELPDRGQPEPVARSAPPDRSEPREQVAWTEQGRPEPPGQGQPSQPDRVAWMARSSRGSAARRAAPVPPPPPPPPPEVSPDLVERPDQVAWTQRPPRDRPEPLPGWGPAVTSEQGRPPQARPRPSGPPERSEQGGWPQPPEQSRPAQSHPPERPEQITWASPGERDRPAPPAPSRPGPPAADPLERRDRPESARPRTIVLTPGGTGSAGDAGANGAGFDESDPHDPAGAGAEPAGFPVPSSSPTNGIDLRADPFAALDREMARALAAKLAEALTRYATPALVPLVIDQMAEILEADKPRVTRTGKDSAP